MDTFDRDASIYESLGDLGLRICRIEAVLSKLEPELMAMSSIDAICLCRKMGYGSHLTESPDSEKIEDGNSE